jgi:hypothetical protein
MSWVSIYTLKQNPLPSVKLLLHLSLCCYLKGIEWWKCPKYQWSWSSLISQELSDHCYYLSRWPIKKNAYSLLFWLFAHARSCSSVFACDVGSRYRKLRMLLRCHDIYRISQSGLWRQLKGMTGARGLRVTVYNCIVVVSYVKHIHGFYFCNNK